jgi:hypothetical protein
MITVAWDHATGAGTGPFFPLYDVPDAERGGEAIRVERVAKSSFTWTTSFTNIGDIAVAQVVRDPLTIPLGSGTAQSVTASNIAVGEVICNSLTIPTVVCNSLTVPTVVCNSVTIPTVVCTAPTAPTVSSYFVGGTVRRAAFIGVGTAQKAGSWYFDSGTPRKAGRWYFSSGMAQPAAPADFTGGMARQADVTASDASASVAPGQSVIDLHPSLSRCLRALYSREILLSHDQVAALERQLQVLLREEEELRSSNINVSVPSLHGLIDFLSEHQMFAQPGLSITRAGHFAASWSPRKRAKLTIVFRPDSSGDWNADDLDATPPLHQKDTLANRQDEFAVWVSREGRQNSIDRPHRASLSAISFRS